MKKQVSYIKQTSLMYKLKTKSQAHANYWKYVMKIKKKTLPFKIFIITSTVGLQ